MISNDTITTWRKTYTLGGQTIATRINSDPNGNDGLYYIHPDHASALLSTGLGSTSIMSYGQGHVQQGEEVLGSQARYLPFGDWRVEPGHELTDQGFTGQKHNMDPSVNSGQALGLYYYNARFYLPGIGRFASTDTIVPDPMNPQQFNRYTYTLNNPLRYSDPTGHVCYDHTAGPELLGTCVDENGSTYSLLPPTPIWTGAFLDSPDWAQYFGHTNFSKEHPYNTDGGQHAGLDYGKFAQLFGGTWNLETKQWDFDGMYGTLERPMFPVYAGCYCEVDSTSTGSSYAPGRVNLTHETYDDYLLIYGHLLNIQVTSGSVTPDTIIGYLDTTERHLHLEIRRISDNHFVNPFPYLSNELQVELLSFSGVGSGTIYQPGYPSHPAYQEPGYYLR